MALIERVDTTMYAIGGPRHFLALGGVIAAVVACQSHPPPGECKARADEVAHYVAAREIAPAFEACGCRADQAAREVCAGAVRANHHPVRAVRIHLDRTGTIEA